MEATLTYAHTVLHVTRATKKFQSLTHHVPEILLLSRTDEINYTSRLKRESSDEINSFYVYVLKGRTTKIHSRTIDSMCTI
jgi:hypothetical protein